MQKPSPKTKAVMALLFVVLVLSLLFLAHWRHRHPSVPAGLPPGAAAAITRALGPSGLTRVGQTVAPGNVRSAASGGTHLQSGTFHGRPYALAFDILIFDPATADADTRALRLQGIAAWHRGPGAPGGPAGYGPHIHCVWPGAPTKNRENLEQIVSFLAGDRALADANRPHSAWKDPSIRPDEIAQVRRVTKRVYGRGLPVGIRAYDACHFGSRQPL